MFRSGWRKESAELLGTFALTFAVSTSLLTDVSVATPVVAGLTLLLFVYTLGPVSGAHFNPAVTIGLLSVGKVDHKQALRYIIAQVLGAALAMGAIWRLNNGELLTLPLDGSISVAIAEATGAFILAFGVTSVAMGTVPGQLSGVVIGGSLTLGVLLASAGGNGVLNPAVAFGIGSLNAMYVLGPVLGALLGAQCHVWLTKK